jgi:hypothetical protein
MEYRLAKPRLSSSVIEDVIEQRPHGAAVAYFYFGLRDSVKQAFAQVLKSL